MNKPTKEEMLDMLEAFHQQWQGVDTEPEKWDPEGVRFRDAIRASLLRLDVLEKAVGKWQKTLKDAERHGQDVRGCTFILCEIRDFGEEK